MEKTIFDSILQGELPCKKVFEDEHVLAFEDINPQAPVHILVIPKKKITSIGEADQLSHEEAGHYFQSIGRIAKEVGLAKDGYRVVFNTGKHGQQTVNYIHAHILGGRQLKWPPG